MLAIVWVNTPFAHSYHVFWDVRLTVGIGGNTLSQPLHFWLNDGLMEVFFFVIGLELKRVLMAGELSSFKKALLPMVAAIGGMLVPAGIFALLNTGAEGWGIPMATDIAFALAILSLSAKHVPNL